MERNGVGQPNNKLRFTKIDRQRRKNLSVSAAERNYGIFIVGYERYIDDYKE